MERKERGFFGKLLVFILSILASVGLVAMALSVINPHVNPQHFIWTSLFGLAFWEIFIFNAIVLLLLVLLWSRKAWIAVLAMIVAIPGFNKSFSFGKKSEAAGSIRVMSYNVHMFKPVGKEMDNEDFADNVMDMVRDQNPDIMCCQEFAAFKKGVSRNKCIEDFAEGSGFQYVYFNRKSNFGGNVLFSKYPIEKVSEECGFGEEHTYGVMVSVDAGDKGKFYVACVHLLSYNITDEEIDVLMGPERQEKLDTVGRKMLNKLKFAYKRRSDELQSMLTGMPVIDAPVLVCGDFNETPLSYNYRQMQKAGFVDAFTKVGRGIKPTYAGKLPLLRIDYIWADESVKLLNFRRYRYKGSDHYPLVLDFALQ